MTEARYPRVRSPTSTYSPDEKSYPIMRHDAESLKDKGWMNRSGEQTPLGFNY